MLVCDICNTLADVNGVLARLFGVPPDAYPAPLPAGFFESPEGLLCFRSAEPLPGAAELVRRLSSLLGGPVYVTCRPRAAEAATGEWLRAHGFPDGPLVFCRGAREKAAAALALGASLALEDDPAAAAAYARAGIPVLVPAWPYNRGLEVPGLAARIAIRRGGFVLLREGGGGGWGSTASSSATSWTR